MRPRDGLLRAQGLAGDNPPTRLFRRRVGLHSALKAVFPQQPGAVMPFRALAFHPDVALEKLHEFFADEAAQMNASTSSAVCPRCGLEFTIVFVNKTDAANPEYCRFLCRLVALGCNSGMHESEYVLGD
jgi:hypothetical protein